MSAMKLYVRTRLWLMMIIAIAIWRIFLTLHTGGLVLANFSPLGAMAIFGGACFSSRWKAIGFPLLTLWISDVILGKLLFFHHWQLFYPGFYFTYGAFVLMTLAGRWIVRRITIGRVVMAALASTFIHWIVSDIGVWLDGRTYPLTWQGWIECLVAAIPFELRLLAGTMVYGAVLFGVAVWITKKSAAPATAS
ncbi:hypothetical protein SAMN05660895_1612 [Thermoflavifilum thermophilum]|uniref:Uncharacterized protein n=2 Tax=Thermoflavifilum thermophilum TaxID=1393122 RepID=A0A1I7NF19_9BACT|nr:hypothetical protein SAMN05660895_1612 [Thermoflavifilum thermophilum]